VRGNRTSTRSPPCVCARVSMRALCASATACPIDNPNPSPGPSPCPDNDAPAHDVVAQGVVYEVGDQPLDEPQIPRARGGFDVHVDGYVAILRLGTSGGDHPLGEGGQVERLVPVDTRLAACEREQRFDELLLLSAGREHPFVGRLQRLDARVGIGEGDLPHRALAG
jgi:hypothetical protein